MSFTPTDSTALPESRGSHDSSAVPDAAEDAHDGPHPASHHLGDEPALTGDHRHSTVHRLGRVSTTGGFDLPGEFDLPPEEPVVLIGDVPWELRDDGGPAAD